MEQELLGESECRVENMYKEEIQSITQVTHECGQTETTNQNGSWNAVESDEVYY